LNRFFRIRIFNLFRISNFGFRISEILRAFAQNFLDK